MNELPPPGTDLREYRIAQLEARVGEMAQHVQTIELKFEAREHDRAVEEKRKLWAGISFLGTVVLAMLGVIWAYRGTIFRGQGQ